MQKLCLSTNFHTRKLGEISVLFAVISRGATFFIIPIYDLFFLIHVGETANYADDATPYTTGITIADAIYLFQACSKILFEWFDDSYMKAKNDRS